MRHSSGWTRKRLPTANCRARRRSALFRSRGARKQSCPNLGALLAYGDENGRTATAPGVNLAAHRNAGKAAKAFDADSGLVHRSGDNETKAKEEMRTAASAWPPTTMGVCRYIATGSRPETFRMPLLT